MVTNKNKDTVSSVLRKIDVFGQPVILYVKGQSAYKTRAGGIISLTLFIITIVLFALSLNNLMQRTNITIQEEVHYKSNPPLLNFTNDNFMFSFGMDDPNLTPNNSIFSYNITLVTTKKPNVDNEYSITTEDIINFGICDDTVYDKFDQFNKKYLLPRSFCPINYSYPIQGTSDSPIYKRIKINVNRCVNGTHPQIICAPQQDINQYFQNTSQVKFKLYFVNQKINLYNFDTITQNYIDNQVFYASPLGTLTSKTEIFFRSATIKAYDDLLGVYDPTLIKTHAFEQDRYDWTYVPLPQSQTYFEIELKSSFYETMTSRVYGTLLETIAFIGGIFNLLHLGLGIIAKMINEHAYRVKLANMLYGFDAFDLTSNPNTKSIKLHEDNQESKIINTNNDSNNSKNEVIKKRFDKIKVLRTTLIYPILQYIANKIWCCLSTKLMKKKDQLFNLAYKKISIDIDIENIIRKLGEVEKLKNILFTPDQLGIFNFVETCIISTRKSRRSSKDMDERTKIVKEDTRLLESGLISNFCKELNQYYKHSKMYSQLKRELTPMNENLLSSLNPEVREIFDLIDDAEDNTSSNEYEILTVSDKKGNLILPADKPSKSNGNKLIINGITDEEEKASSMHKLYSIVNEECCIDFANSENEIVTKDGTNKVSSINKVKVSGIIDFQKIQSSVDSNHLTQLRNANDITENDQQIIS